MSEIERALLGGAVALLICYGFRYDRAFEGL